MKHRTLRDAMEADPSLKTVKKNAEGQPLCRYCGGIVSPPRRSFCSAACVHEWKICSHSGYARGCVRRRDRAICALCRLDCAALRRQLNALPAAQRYIRAAELGIPKHRALRRSLWDVDHIIPVAEGGGSCGLENLRCLCIPCHKKETAALRKRLASKDNDGNAPESCSKTHDDAEKPQ